MQSHSLGASHRLIAFGWAAAARFRYKRGFRYIHGFRYKLRGFRYIFEFRYTRFRYRFRYRLWLHCSWNRRPWFRALASFRDIHKEDAARQSWKWVTHQWNITLNTIATDIPIANPMANEYGRPLTGMFGSALWW